MGQFCMLERHSFWVTARALALVTAALSGRALSGPPVISAIDLRALQTGTVTTVTFTGTDLLPNPRLLSGARIRSQKVREGAKPDRVSMEVELEADAVPGLENVWLATDEGVSARAVFGVDALPQKALSAQKVSLPVALHGSVNASQASEASFSGKAGQMVRCEVEAQRLQSKLRPVLKLYDARSRLLAWSPPQTHLRGDCRLEFRLPADGEYRLQIHDLLYAAAAPAHFRLKVGEWAYADAAFPSTVQKGSSAEVQVVGAFPEGESVRLPSDVDGEAVRIPWPGSARASGVQASGAQAFVWLSEVPQIVEQSGSGDPQTLPALPVSVNGRISKPGEVDVYVLSVEPETEVEVEVVADGIGSPVDAELELRDAKGARLAVADDSTGNPDPKLLYKVPKGVSSIQAVVRDVGGIGGPHAIYRLQAAAKTGKPPETFALKLVEDSQSLRVGSPGVFKVEVAREGGYSGPVDLRVGPLPKGVLVSGTHVPAEATGALLVFSSHAAFDPLILSLKGAGGGQEKTARVASALGGASRFQPWLDSDVALTGMPASPVAFSAEWGADAAKQSLVLSGKAKLPLRVHRPPAHDGPVRLSLITSQARVFKQAQLDTTRMLREEKAVTVAEDKKVQQLVDAVAAASKQLGAAKAAADAAAAKGAVPDALAAAVTKAQSAVDDAKKALDAASAQLKNDAEVVLLVPADLPQVPHQIACKAEFLKRDGKTVESVSYTPVLEIPVLNPLQITLDDPVGGVLDPKSGASVEISGRVERRESAKGEVTVTLTGLPAGVAQPAAVKVKEGQQDFKFAVKFPAATRPGPVESLRVSAQGNPFGTTPVKSREMSVNLTLQAAGAQPASKPPG